MIKSMTAYARADRTDEELTVSAEFRSYNSRYLDVVLRLPHAYLSLEPKIKTMIAQHLRRGRIEVRTQIREQVDSAQAFDLDVDRARAFQKILHQLGDSVGIERELSLDMFLAADGIIRPPETEANPTAVWPALEACLEEGLAALDQMRREEGIHIERDFFKRLAAIETLLERIEEEMEDLLTHYQQRLQERIGKLTNGIVTLDPARIAQEAAFLADRSDISEEVVRAKSHLAQFAKIIQGKSSAGQKLNFLLQEMNREFNTMGAKASNAAVSQTIVHVKAEVEKIREQVQNVE
jgi:uncharacterized protein (TIGR00255 family)